MKAFHTACGSTKLDSMIIPRRGKLITVKICLHCVRIIEEQEITHTVPLVISKVSDGDINTPEDKDKLLELVITRR